jgi:hypothetical protein
VILVTGGRTGRSEDGCRGSVLACAAVLATESAMSGKAKIPAPSLQNNAGTKDGAPGDLIAITRNCDRRHRNRLAIKFK